MYNKLSKIINSSNSAKYYIDNFYNHKGTSKWSIKRRTIKNNMLVMAISGNGYYEIDDVKHPIKPGRIYLISHDIVHSAAQSDDKPVIVIAIRFSYKIYNEIDQKDYFPKCSFVYDPVDINTLYGIMLNLNNHISRYTVNNVNQDIINGLMSSIFNIIFSEWYFYNNEPYDNLMSKVNFTIESHLRSNKNINIDLFLNKFHMSQYEFTNRFQKHYKSTFRNYIYTKKMEYAEELLQTTDLKINEIASILGYSDQYIFSNQFKKKYLCSPRQYRSVKN